MACCVSQQTCLLCHTADMSDVSLIVQTRLLVHTADMSGGSRSRHVCGVVQQNVCCVARQINLPCDTADMPAVWRNRHVCFVAQQILSITKGRVLDKATNEKLAICIYMYTHVYMAVSRFLSSHETRKDRPLCLCTLTFKITCLGCYWTSARLSARPSAQLSARPSA